MEQFSINDNGDFEVSWNVTAKYSKMHLTDLIKNLLSELKVNLTEYETITFNDGKLIGNEKITMIRGLGDLIQILVFSRTFISKNYAKDSHNNPKLSVTMKNETDFTLRGQLNLAEMNEIINLGDWLKSVLVKLVSDYTNEIKKSLEDKVITIDEGKTLCTVIDKIILKTLNAYYKLSYQNLIR